MKALLVSVALVALAGPALAEDLPHAVVVDPDNLNWAPNRALPKGALSVSLVGDSNKPGIFIRRHKLPPNYRIPPHTHPDVEVVTVISGSFAIGQGETFDEKAAKPLKAGALFATPGKHPHFAWTGPEETIIQVHGIAPTNIEYINPADDPRKAQ